MRIITAANAVILLLALSVASVSHSRDSSSATVGLEVEFTKDEVRQIRAFYESQSATRKPKKSSHANKAKPLPPGIAKNLARGKPLPPGIAKQALPYQLRKSLPPVRSGYERVIVAGKVLLVEIATQVVRDILSDAILN